MTHSTHTISPLRQRMIDDMVLRRLNSGTQTAYLRAVVKFTRFLRRSSDLATPEDHHRGLGEKSCTACATGR